MPDATRRYAVVCSSNQNRSMETHLVFQRHGFNIESYGTGSAVKLPGPSIDKPNVFGFDDTTYEDMYKQLKEQNFELYSGNGVLDMLERNMAIKPRPEKFQRQTKKRFDIILTCESRIFDEVLRDLEERDGAEGTPVHIINLDIPDNHSAATVGALNLYKLAQMMEASEDLDDDIDDIIETFQKETGEELLHALAFY
ncbi:uncharacterized protein MONBRDRAFT_21202 [Monosiga brevicollis MX1]|uniref:RNA polymerase II subunit A C-terminal domain phosphatase SSU72 n=1 Tax=Monosiga brevicollis TaxID=81824 RepID=A9URK0_MONBE|nr:uncharacterized protein MONBRDRAFT_21202 [Monosiga brevicollis MX1]EDQ91937.1 predicted protein [Monosiga brevicollis MX1]|eukprot:XP_001743223.1 hypothetical protein [Monosiga brevicollis MX1]